MADLAQDLSHNIQLQTEELQKLDEARERAWHDERAAAAEQLADARLEQVEPQAEQPPERIKNEIRAAAPDAAELHDRMHLAAMATAAVETAVTKQLADEQTNVMQLEERLTAHVEAAIESRAARWDCWAERQDAWDAARAKMTDRERSRCSSSTPRA